MTDASMLTLSRVHNAWYRSPHRSLCRLAPQGSAGSAPAPSITPVPPVVPTWAHRLLCPVHSLLMPSCPPLAPPLPAAAHQVMYTGLAFTDPATNSTAGVVLVNDTKSLWSYPADSLAYCDDPTPGAAMPAWRACAFLSTVGCAHNWAYWAGGTARDAGSRRLWRARESVTFWVVRHVPLLQVARRLLADAQSRGHPARSTPTAAQAWCAGREVHRAGRGAGADRLLCV